MDGFDILTLVTAVSAIVMVASMEIAVRAEAVAYKLRPENKHLREYKELLDFVDFDNDYYVSSVFRSEKDNYLSLHLKIVDDRATIIQLEHQSDKILKKTFTEKGMYTEIHYV